MNAQRSLTVCVAHRFDAPPEQVFDAWLDPEKVRHWFAPGMGQMIHVLIDARVGGTFSIMQRRDGEDVDHVGEYLEIERPRRLVFTWSVPKSSPERARVVVEIQPEGWGSKATLTHELHPLWASHAEQSEQAWSSMMEAMPKTLG